MTIHLLSRLLITISSIYNMSFNYTVQLEVFTDVCKSKHSIINVNKRNKQNITAAAKSICARKQNILAK